MSLAVSVSGMKVKGIPAPSSKMLWRPLKAWKSADLGRLRGRRAALLENRALCRTAASRVRTFFQTLNTSGCSYSVLIRSQLETRTRVRLLIEHHGSLNGYRTTCVQMNRVTMRGVSRNAPDREWLVTDTAGGHIPAYQRPTSFSSRGVRLPAARIALRRACPASSR